SRGSRRRLPEVTPGGSPARARPQVPPVPRGRAGEPFLEVPVRRRPAARPVRPARAGPEGAMNGRREVRNQAEFDAAIAAGDRAVVLDGDIRLETSGEARPIIEVLGKAILRLIARGSSQPHV